MAHVARGRVPYVQGSSFNNNQPLLIGSLLLATGTVLLCVCVTLLPYISIVPVIHVYHDDTTAKRAIRYT